MSVEALFTWVSSASFSVWFTVVSSILSSRNATERIALMAGLGMPKSAEIW